MAHLPKETTTDDLIAAMLRFDTELRETEEWRGWTEKKGQCFAILHDGKLYPPKKIISLATGRGVHTFSGGAESNTYLTRRGFSIIALRQKSPPRSRDGQSAAGDQLTSTNT